jgi:anthranilate phosphoribosyltransferase
VVGVAEPSRLPLIAGALAALGTVRALVVHGDPGMDEISPLGPHPRRGGGGRPPSRVVDRPGGARRARRPGGGLAGGDPATTRASSPRCSTGAGDPVARDAVVLNAAAALYVAGAATSYAAAVAAARAALAAGVGRGGAGAAAARLRRLTPRAGG